MGALGSSSRVGRSGSVTWWIRPRKARSSESVGMPLMLPYAGRLIGRMVLGAGFSETVPPLPMEGSLPPDLQGMLYRVGPGRRDGAGSARGALHAVELRDGQAVSYLSVDSPADAGVFWHAGSVLALPEAGLPSQYSRL